MAVWVEERSPAMDSALSRTGQRASGAAWPTLAPSLASVAEEAGVIPALVEAIEDGPAKCHGGVQIPEEEP